MDCSICLESNEEKFSYPKHCLCKVYFHEQCLNKCEEFGILCPICRKNKDNTNYQNEIHDIVNYLDRPMRIFTRHPNIFTFILVFIYSLFITIFVFVPILVYISYPNLFRYIIDIIIIILCIITVNLFLK